MTNRKLLLNYLIDIGGVATINNMYSLEAKSYKGGILQARKLFKFYVANGLIKHLDPIINPRNPSQEIFYFITKQGADFVGREDYKWKGVPKSPFNTFHESMKFDFALSWIKHFGSRETKIEYQRSFSKVRPDITITYKGRKYLVELERKKTIDRTVREKFIHYEKMFMEMKEKKYDNPKNYTVLFVFTNTWYNVFARPQQYEYYLGEIKVLHEMTKELAKKCRSDFLFMPFSDFYKLNDVVWYKSDGNRIKLI
ncbi:MAG: hypothetical protein HY959_03860 [Ignavibacteriae bacterium]|nr:hypothetical protein [Ignavibacteriota bacterium]